MKKIAVILAGCGSMDGSEIHESVSVLQAIKKFNADYQCFTLNQDQFEVIDHLQKIATTENRNCMVESARIARGNVLELETLQVKDYDAIIFPGGLGAAKNLFSYAYEGENATVNNIVSEKLLQFYQQKKMIGAVCISPIIIALTLRDFADKPLITLGKNNPSVKFIQKLGFSNKDTTSNDFCVDPKHNIATACAYMDPNADIFSVYCGIEKMVKYIIQGFSALEFENIISLDDLIIQKILKKLETEQLVLALKGSSMQIKEKILSNMSEKAKEIIEIKIKELSPSRLQEIEEAKLQMCQIAENFIL